MTENDNMNMMHDGKEALDRGDIKKAVDIFEEITRLDNDNYDAFVYLGVAYSKQNRYNPAIGAFKRASELRPDSHQIHYNLGQAYEAAGVPREAYAEYKKALEINAFYTKAQQALAELSEKLPELTSGGIVVEGDK